MEDGDDELRVELWGCGFNQFGQINDSGDDVYNLTLIDYAQSWNCPSIKLLWAGWADLLCTSRIDIKLIKDSINKDQLNPHMREFGPFEYKYRGGVYNGKDIEELGRSNEGSQRPYCLLDGFGNDALLGINEKLSSGSLLLQKDGNHTVLRDIRGIAVAGNGYVACISKGILYSSTNRITFRAEQSICFQLFGSASSGFDSSTYSYNHGSPIHQTERISRTHLKT